LSAILQEEFFWNRSCFDRFARSPRRRELI
jgi:hypothetical protein